MKSPTFTDLFSLQIGSREPLSDQRAKIRHPKRAAPHTGTRILCALLGVFTGLLSVVRGASDVDVSFNADARAFGTGYAVAFQSDGKLVVGGGFAQARGAAIRQIARFNPDGTLDTSFAVGGALDSRVRTLAIQSDGKIVIGGLFTTYGVTTRNRIARLNADGSLDTTFNPGTGFDSEVLDLVIQPDGKIIAVGLFTTFNGTARGRVARLNADGSLDTTFLVTGAAANGEVWDVVLQSDNKPVIVGAFTTYNGTARNRIARLTTAGALDTTIAFTGGANETIYGLAIDTSGRFVIGGLFTSWNSTARRFIARLTTAGLLDTTFDPGATSFDDVVARLTHDSAGRVVVAGLMTSFGGTALPMAGVARLTSAGAADASFAPATGAFALARGGPMYGVTIGPGDSLALAGSVYAIVNGAAGVAWLGAGGSPMAGFDPGVGLTYSPVINAVRSGRNGNYWVVGWFDWISGALRHDVVRFLPNAQLDPTFVPSEGFGRGAYFNAPVTDAVELPNGNLWTFGNFTKYGRDFDRPGAALFSPGGYPEITWTDLTITGGYVQRALLNTNGTVTLAGTFTAINGTPRAGVARVETDGDLDLSFVPGSGPLGGTITSVDLDSSGRLIIGGTFTSFSGTNESFIVRLGTAGAVDTAFAGNTNVNALVNSVQVLPDTKILVGGVFATSGGYTVNGIDRLNADGTSDVTFNPGTGANSYVYDAVADASGRPVVAGAFTAMNGVARPGGLARLSTNGSPVENLFAETALGGGYPFTLSIRPDGKILARGSFTAVDGLPRAGLARFHSTPARRGSLATAFAGAALATGDVRAAIPTSDGGFVIAGDFTSASGLARNRIAKIGPTGQVDPSFVYSSGFNSTVNGGLTEPDGRLLFWGAFGSYNGAGAGGVVRINADGARDAGFTAPTFNSAVHSVVRLADGRYLVAGAFTSADATPAGGLARLNANGSLDLTFNAGTGANSAVFALARATDGTIFAGGGFSTFAGAPAPGVVKLLTDGARASGFNIGTGNPTSSLPVRALALQADGKLIVGGSFTTFSGPAERIVRLNADGSRDTTFLNGLGADAAVNVLAPLADGRLYVAGGFTALGGGEQRGLARLSADGRIDPVIDVGTGFNQEVLAVTPLADGRIAVGGKFTTVSGATRNRFAVLYADDGGAPLLPGDTFQTIEVDPGQPFSISLGASVAGISYQWYRDGVLLPGATGASYSVAAAALVDLGTYTTVLSTGGGEYTTLGTRVIVKLAPAVTAAPVALTAGYGANATFNVTVSGAGPFTYQWYRNGELIPGATGASLTLTNVGDTDFGDTFFVRITNAYGSHDTAPVAMTFDPAAVPGAVVRAFPNQNPVVTQPAKAMIRTPAGQYYVGSAANLLRLNADGSTDTSFAPAFTNLSVDVLALQSDGKLVVAGYLQPTGSATVWNVLRLLPSGAVDPAFSAPTLDYYFSVDALALQADNKIVLGGSFLTVNGTARQNLARLNADGTLDATFAPIDAATGPNAGSYVTSILVQGTNLIIAGNFTTYRGTTVNRLVRVTSANVVDGTFTGGTRADAVVEGMLAQSDGKLLVRGQFLSYNGTPRNRLARLNADGSLDSAFDPGVGPQSASRFDTPTVTDFARGENNTVIVHGVFDSFSGWPAVGAVRLTATGAIDTQWASTGPNVNGGKLLPTSDGLLFVGGYLSLPGLPGTQYFGRILGGSFPPQPPSIITQPAGNTFVRTAGSRHSLSVLATGPGTLTFQWLRNGTPVTNSTLITGATGPVLTFRSLRATDTGTYTVRVTSSTQGPVDSQPAQVNVGPETSGPGSLDLSWAADPLPRSLLAIDIAADGSAHTVGNDWNLDESFVFKFDANGVLQPASIFAQGSGFDSGPTQLVRQADGKVIAVGYFSTVMGASRTFMARLNSNGTLDTTFNPAPDAGVSVLVQQADGKLLVGGSFSTIAGTARVRVARLLATGVIDTTFVPGTHGLTEVLQLLVATDGRIYMRGRNSTTATDDIVRLTATGALDGTFVRVTSPSNTMQDLTLDASGRLIVVGTFSSIAGQARNRVARFSSTGTVDLTFGPALSVGAGSSALNKVSVGPDGYHYITSDSSNFTYDGFNLGSLIRLDPNGQLDTGFPAPTAGRFASLSPSALRWIGDKLILAGGTWVRVNTTGGATGAPVLLESTGDRTVVEGIGVSLSARFAGSGPFTYVWRRNGTIIPGAGSPQLWLASPSSADGGTYTVTATNSFGSQTVTMSLSFFAADVLSPIAGLTLSSSFNGAVSKVVRRPDGSILVAGGFRTAAGINSPGIARIKPDGTLDMAFAAALPFAASGTPAVTTLAIESDGRILLQGSLPMPDGSNAYLVRLTAAGALADLLLTSNNTSNVPTLMALQADGKIVVIGGFATILGSPRAGLARLMANGTLDPAYQTAGLTINPSVVGASLEADGRLLLAGGFTSVGGVPTGGRVIRLNTDGTLDSTYVSPLSVQLAGMYRANNGRIFIWSTGNALAQIGGNAVRLVQLKADGTVDPAFVNTATTTVTAMGEDSFGRMYVGYASSLVRLLPGGLPDRSVPLSSQIRAMTAVDTRLLVAGGNQLSSVNTVAVNGIALLSTGAEDSLAILTAPATAANISEGGTLTLRAGIRGPAGTTYQWFRDGVAVIGATSAVLNLDGVTPAAHGAYTLVATYAGNAITTSATQVTVQPNLGLPGEIDVAWGDGRTTDGVTSFAADSSGNPFLVGNVVVNGGAARPLVALSATGGARAGFTLSSRVTGGAIVAQVQTDGRILLAGNPSSLKLDGANAPIVRLEADGSVDPTFATGQAISNVTSIAPMADGRILLYENNGITVLLANGTVDATFTRYTASFPGILLPAPAGKFWLVGPVTDNTAGTTRLFIRLNANGTPDTTFAAPLSYPVNSSSESLRTAAAAPDGGFYLLSSISGSPTSYQLRRVTPQGAYDTAFSPGVFARADFPTDVAALNDIAVDSVGRVLVAGSFSHQDRVARNGIVRLLPDGSPDLSFHTPLPIAASQLNTPSRLFAGSNRVLAYGSNLTNYGGLGDRSYLYGLYSGDLPAGTAPVLAGSVAAVNLPPYDQLVLSLPVVAPAAATIQWYRDGALLPGITGTSLRLPSASPTDTGSYHAIVQTAGGTLTVPAVTVTVPTPTYSGALSARNASTRLEGTVRLAVSQPDGRILLVTDGVFVNGAGAHELVRLNADGTFHSALPTLIRPPSDNSSPVQAAVVDGAGRIYLGGSFTKVNGVTRNRVVRLNADGTLDLTWDPGTGANNTVSRLALAPGDKLIIGGSFSQVAGVARQFLARLNADGTFDPTLVTGTGLGALPLAIVAQADGRIVVGGNFTAYNGSNVGQLIRLGTTGTLDATFAPAPNSSVTSLLALPDGRLLAGGSFSLMGTTTAAGLALLSSDGALLVPVLNSSGGYTALAVGPDGSFFGLAGSQVYRFSATGVRDIFFSNANGYRGAFTNAASTPTTVNPTSLVMSGNDLLVAGPFARSGASTRNGVAWIGVSASALPVIVTPPVSTILPEGGSVNLTVSAATPTGTLTYTWTKVGQGTVLSTTNSLSRTNVTLANAGTYRVVVSNGEGSVEATAQLTVNALPPAGPGSPLLTFTATGVSSVTKVQPAGDGKWWVLANSQLVRVLADGSADPGYVAPIFTGGVSGFELGPDGRIYVFGNFTAINGQPASRLARLSSAGVLDLSFTSPFSTATIYAIAFAPDGRLYVGGSFVGLLVAGQPTNHLVRLLDSGAIDSAFNPSGGLSADSSNVQALALLADGRLIVGGTFSSAAGTARKGLVRFLANGALDPTFNNIDIAQVTRLAVLADGRMMVAGGFSTVDGLNRPRLARLGANGVVDASFAVTEVTLSNVNKIIPRPDGRLVVLAMLTESSTNRARVLQFLENGSLDPAFDYLHSYNTNSTGTTGNFADASLLPNGNLLVAGSFSYIDSGISRTGLVMVKGSPLLPEITSGALANQSVNAGTNVSFSITATGPGTLTYQWRVDGEAIDGATAATLTLTSVTAADAGSYDVVVSNTYGSVTSNTATLAVNAVAQTITFGTLPDVPFTFTPIALSATSSSGLAVEYSIVSGPATVAGTSLTLTGTGMVTVRASQPGNASFSAATPVERTFTVTANFASWQQANFNPAELANAAVSGPNAIFGADGLTNLVKYALGLAPKVNATIGLPTVTVVGTDWTYTYKRPVGIVGITYEVQASTNLSAWSTASVTHEFVSTSGGFDTWRARYPVASAANLYFRLKVTQP